MANRGTFIVIDGGDGAGKDTCITHLQNVLTGHDIVYVKDPGGTKSGEKIRSIVLTDKTIGPRAELLLYLASRAQLLSEVIIPALENGRHVISNRFDLSTVAYQLHGRKWNDISDIPKDVNTFASGNVIPDLYILLDVDPKTGLRRKRQSEEELNRFDSEALAFHERVHKAYLEHISGYPRHAIINADQSVARVTQEVEKVVRSALT